MPLYAFYPQLPAGSTTLFEVYELEGDEVVLAQAEAVLADHPDAVSVAVWQALRFVRHVERAEEPAEARHGAKATQGKAYRPAEFSESAEA